MVKHMEIEREDLKKSEQSSLLPGLPDDIALCCLAKVPRKLLHLLKCVSKRWNELVSGEEWHAYRMKHHLEETWIYALCKDISDQLCLYVLDTYELKKGWKRINGIPDQCLKRKGVGFEVLGKNVFLIGGCGWIEDATKEVYCYDASANKWAEASPLATARCYFGCESLDGKIYSIGGIVPKPSNRYSYDIYTPQKNNWTTYEDSNVRPHIEDSVVLDEKIYIRCCASSVLTSHVNAVVYEPSSATWQLADRDLVSGWRGPAVVINGIFYVLDQTSGVKLMMWDKSSREWISLRRFSTHFISPPCQLVGIGNKMFIIGKGLSTVVFDVADIGRIDGVLSQMESLLPGLPDEIAVSCLARVPRKYMHLLNCVSKKWNDLVNGEEWHSDRTRNHLDETWIYALCRNISGPLFLYVLDPNKLQKGWKQINGIPNRCLKRKGIGFGVGKESVPYWRLWLDRGSD